MVRAKTSRMSHRADPARLISSETPPPAAPGQEVGCRQSLLARELREQAIQQSEALISPLHGVVEVGPEGRMGR